jgi:hypothetical protein
LLLETTAAVRSHVGSMPRRCKRLTWSHEMLLGASLASCLLLCVHTTVQYYYSLCFCFYRCSPGSGWQPPCEYVTRVFFCITPYSMICKNSCSCSDFFRVSIEESSDTPTSGCWCGLACSCAGLQGNVVVQCHEHLFSYSVKPKNFQNFVVHRIFEHMHDR